MHTSWIGLLTACIIITVVTIGFCEHFDIGTHTSLQSFSPESPDAWSSVTSYVPGDYVVNNNEVYRCSVANTDKEPTTWFWHISGANWYYWDRVGDFTTAIQATLDDSIFGAIKKGVGIYGSIMTFNVDDMPDAFSWFFWTLTTLEAIAIIGLARGTS